MNPLPQRKSPCLQGYNYTQEGAYFITICTFQRKYLFGDIVDGIMKLSDTGQIADEEITKITQHTPYPDVDMYVVMPNHVHMILILENNEKQTQQAVSLQKTSRDDNRLKSGAVGIIVRSYKSAVTRRINKMSPDAPLKIWQPRFHDHIIRDEKSLNYIRQYVYYNPAKWEEDTFYDSQ